MLIAEVTEFTLPTNSSIIFGGSPAAGMTLGAEMIRAIPNNYTQKQLRAIELFEDNGKDNGGQKNFLLTLSGSNYKNK